MYTWKMDAEQLVYANGVLKEYSVGKQPAWIDYMTNYNETRYRDWETDRKSTRLNSSHSTRSRMPSSA